MKKKSTTWKKIDQLYGLGVTVTVKRGKRKFLTNGNSVNKKIKKKKFKLEQKCLCTRISLCAYLIPAQKKYKKLEETKF